MESIRLFIKMAHRTVFPSESWDTRVNQPTVE
jgi:hypothetical protein